ncbi:helix-turn-helix transcriptional regulator [Aestuariimicrobium sp. T2.26MG-19.2B]|uniref:helix-turn-helix transcriptional regulator n=1 Tax=Aestuariimicrobium sp. T2.26MG-19.2B TaxID=3040679 RepID=UPI0024779BE0|nr:hypothetical protein [Aestuariimicrobium sp. T2.26MG-19.2B]CAI9411493.1 hypothetical protein AESSP_02662 [Aestuariimicrobium sp. T2.26MG-19.2B]
MTMPEETVWLTRSETAAALGVGVHALPGWIAEGFLPLPTRRGRGAGHHWRLTDIAPALAARAAHVQSRLHISDVAARLGVSREALKSRRRRGTIPPPDGRDGEGSWWHSSTIDAHQADDQTPPDAVMGLAGAAAFLHVGRSTINLAALPHPDGRRSGVSWWLPQTLSPTRTLLHQPQLWTLQEVSAHLRVPVDELHAIPAMPAPVATLPDRWEAQEIRLWWTAWWQSIRTNPDVLFSRDLPEVTGLTYDTIRTYNAKGRLPSPDGRLRGLPWWHRRTITDWVTTRPLGPGGRRPISERSS